MSRTSRRMFYINRFYFFNLLIFTIFHRSQCQNDPNLSFIVTDEILVTDDRDMEVPKLAYKKPKTTEVPTTKAPKTDKPTTSTSYPSLSPTDATSYPSASPSKAPKTQNPSKAPKTEKPSKTPKETLNESSMMDQDVFIVTDEIVVTDDRDMEVAKLAYKKPKTTEVPTTKAPKTEKPTTSTSYPSVSPSKAPKTEKPSKTPKETLNESSMMDQDVFIDTDEIVVTDDRDMEVAKLTYKKPKTTEVPTTKAPKTEKPTTSTSYPSVSPSKAPKTEKPSKTPKELNESSP